MKIDIAKITELTQLVALVVGTVAKIEVAHKEPGSGPVKKEEAEQVISQAIAVAVASGKLTVSDRKGFDKSTGKIIDGVVGWAKTSEWE